MQQTHPAIDQSDAQNRAPEAAAIPPAGPDEAAGFARVELDRFLTLLDSLEPSDWERPTYCTRWNVRQIVSHLAGATSVFADRDRVLERSAPWLEGKAAEPGQSMASYLADLSGMPLERRRSYRDAGFNPLDTLTQWQVDERAGASPTELIAELRASGPKAIANRPQLPDTLRSLQLPIGTGVRVPLMVFVDVILPRDMWMHRMEIALATGHEIVRTADHEGRLTALVMRDLARRLTPVLQDTSAVYRLTGPDGGAFRYGPDAAPQAQITVDTVDFHLIASGRLTPDEARSRGVVRVDGDEAVAGQVLAQTSVPY